MTSNIKEKKVCPCCTNKYNNSYRKECKCPYCPWISCNMCCRQYILTKASPQCMSCKSIWTDDFLFSIFPKTWVDNDLREHLDNVLYQQEKSLFPLAVVHIEKEQMERELRKAQTERLHYENQIQRLHTIMNRNNSTFITSTELKECEEKYNISLKLEIELAEKLGKPIVSKSRRPCPNYECKGFVDTDTKLLTELKCSICKGVFCLRCRDKLNKSTHVCDENTVKTIKLTDQDTKPCPSCKVPVFRIEGCNQMFCTICHTAFNWVTGEMEKGRIHNPHYFEWLSMNGEQNNQQLQNGGIQLLDPCGRPVENLPGQVNKKIDIIYPSVSDTESINESKKDCIHFVHMLIRCYHHIHAIERPTLQENTVRHLMPRIRFITNQIIEEDWKKIISMKERDHKKQFLWLQIVDTIYTIIGDILYKIINRETEIKFVKNEINIKMKEYIPDFYIEIYNIVDYFNDISRKYSLRFNMTYYRYITKGLYFENKKTVKDEVPPTFSITNVCEIFDWMDTLEKECIEYVKDKVTTCDKINEITTLIYEDDNNYFNKIQLFSKLKKHMVELGSDVGFYFLELSEKIKIRDKRKIRNDILIEHIRFLNKNLKISFTKVNKLIEYRFNCKEIPEDNFYIDYVCENIGTFKVSLNLYMIICGYVLTLRKELNRDNMFTILEIINFRSNKYYENPLDLYHCYMNDNKEEKFTLISVIIIGFISSLRKLSELGNINTELRLKCIEQLYVNINIIRYSIHYNSTIPQIIRKELINIINIFITENMLNMDKNVKHMYKKALSFIGL